MIQAEVKRHKIPSATAPTVSVIIPAYNAAKFIGETLNSVFRQTFTSYEVIVINDGSLDTEDLERELKRYPEGLSLHQARESRSCRSPQHRTSRSGRRVCCLP